MGVIARRITGLFLVVLVLTGRSVSARQAPGPHYAELLLTTGSRVERWQKEGTPFDTARQLPLTDLMKQAYHLSNEVSEVHYLNRYGHYTLALAGQSWRDYYVVATDPVGGRNYRLCPRFRIIRLVFRSGEERRALGVGMRSFYRDELGGADTSLLFIALPSRYGLTGGTDADVQFSLGSYLGDFVAGGIAGEGDWVLDIAFSDSQGALRRRCLKSLASAWQEMSMETRGRVAGRAKLRLDVLNLTTASREEVALCQLLTSGDEQAWLAAYARWLKTSEH